jgi:hypothetical protein
LQNGTNKALITDWKRLDKLHIALAASRDSKLLLNRHVWVSGHDGRSCVYLDTNSIAQNLDIFQKELSSHEDRAFTLCAINTNVNDEFEIFMSSRRRAKMHFSDLRDLIISDRWPDVYQKIVEYILEVKDSPPSQLSWQPQLPSCAFAASLSPKERLLLDLDITLEWVRELPVLEQDWNIYVSEPHAQRPRISVFRLVAITALDSTDCRLVLLATSAESLDRYKTSHYNARDANKVEMSMKIENQVFNTLLATLDCVISEVTQYTTASVKVVHALVSLLSIPLPTPRILIIWFQDLAARRKPSTSKVHFLMHLLECHDWAAKACHRNAGLVSKLFASPLPVQADVLQWSETSQKYVDDFRYLASEMESHAHKIEDLQEVIKALIDLSDRRRNRTIGGFIALYVPLAFATVRLYKHWIGTTTDPNSLSLA